MNIGYIFDLNGILASEDLCIPYLGHLYFTSTNANDLTVEALVKTRDEVMRNVQTTVDKHQFFFVIKNDNFALEQLAECVSDIQNDKKHFNRQNYEMHVVCNFVEDDGFNIKKYEAAMPCLTVNDVGVYSWFLHKYDYNADRPISVKRRAHGIIRLVDMVNKYDDISNALLQMTHTTKNPKPIYNLFGDSCVFFDNEKRDKSVLNFYSMKSIQHLLNIADKDLDRYLNENVLPFAGNKKEIDRRFDATAEDFLKSISVPVEASVITEKTQGLLIKSSDDDKEYLVNATNNKLVFIDELAQNEDWKLKEMDSFLSEFQTKARLIDEEPEIVSKDFLESLYYEKYIIHEREGFDRINNQVSESRKKHLNAFKHNVESCMNGFLNQQGDENYASLQVPLTKQETNKHHTNIDFGIAFLEYLESGKGDALTDKEVSMGDINFTEIKKSLTEEEYKRRQEYERKKEFIKEKYLPQGGEEISKIQKEFEKTDKRIRQCRQEKRQCEYQLNHWTDGDSEKKITARTKSVLIFLGGVLAALLWLCLSLGYLSDFMSKSYENYNQVQWELFTFLIFAGIIIGAMILYKAKQRLKEAEEALDAAFQHKRNLMLSCVKDINDVTEKHYSSLLAYHGLKTIEELIAFSVWKKDDLVSFRKTLFKMMIEYIVSNAGNEPVVCQDDNTFEVIDKNPDTILFGPADNRREIPYCFAMNGFELSKTFGEYKRRKVRFETTRNSFGYKQRDFDQAELEKEVIPCMKEHENSGIKYSALNGTSILPADVSEVEIGDIHQGACGDCYFMATLAAIANTTPEYVIGKNGMVEELGEDHRFFRVKFYDKDGTRVSVDIDNKFWNLDDTPYYAKKGIPSPKAADGSYDPWVMAVEKAWAKINGNGYDGIEGAREDGKEYERKVEYSFAVTGKSAFYCMTKSISDSNKLVEMMKKHVVDDKLPITLYSFAPGESEFADQNLVSNHAYALHSVNKDGTFNIFNPWNTHEANEDIRGKHYEKVDGSFIKDNFAVVVFFGIKEADFDSFERELTQNSVEGELTRFIEDFLKKNFDDLKLEMSSFGDLLTDETMDRVISQSIYLFSQNIINDQRGVEGGHNHMVFLEGGRTTDSNSANEKLSGYLREKLAGGIALQPIILRDDIRQSLTIFRLSPHYLKENFND